MTSTPSTAWWSTGRWCGTRSAGTRRRRSPCSSTRGSSGACCCRGRSTVRSTSRSVTPAREALRALGLVSGFSHMEWFRRADGSVAVSEVGARPPGAQFTTLMSFAHDVDLYAAWAHLMVYDEFDPPERRWAVGAAYLRPQGHGHIRAVHGVDQLDPALHELVVQARLPQAGQPTSSSYEGDGYVIVRHRDTRRRRAGPRSADHHHPSRAGVTSWTC